MSTFTCEALAKNTTVRRLIAVSRSLTSIYGAVAARICAAVSRPCSYWFPKMNPIATRVTTRCVSICTTGWTTGRHREEAAAVSSGAGCFDWQAGARYQFRWRRETPLARRVGTFPAAIPPGRRRSGAGRRQKRTRTRLLPQVRFPGNSSSIQPPVSADEDCRICIEICRLKPQKTQLSAPARQYTYPPLPFFLLSKFPHFTVRIVFFIAPVVYL